nr:unnamed protein product [Callosobruchus chinensis]
MNLLRLLMSKPDSQEKQGA